MTGLYPDCRDEAREAGIEHFIFVTGRNKSVIEDHFDKQYEWNQRCASVANPLNLISLKRICRQRTNQFHRQQEPLGLGHAIWCARNIVGNEPFAVLLPDMVMHARPGCLSQMIATYNERGGGNVIAVEEVSPDQVHRYGVVGANDWRGKSFTIDKMVEKPRREDAPSNLIISGRYILQSEIFDEISSQTPGAGGEIQITEP